MKSSSYTIEKYIREFSPRFKPSDHLNVDEYLERSVSMVSDCCNLARWEQQGRRIFSPLTHAFPRYSGYAKLRLAVQTTNGAHVLTAIRAVRRELLLAKGLVNPTYLVAILDNVVNYLNKTKDVNLLDITHRLKNTHKLFKKVPDYSVSPINDLFEATPATPNEFSAFKFLPKPIEISRFYKERDFPELQASPPRATIRADRKPAKSILADLEYVEARKGTYTYEKPDVLALNLESVGVLGEYSRECTYPARDEKCLIMKWEAVAYTDHKEEPNSTLLSREFPTKEEAISWATDTLRIKNDAKTNIVNRNSQTTLMYPAHVVTLVKIQEINNVTGV